MPLNSLDVSLFRALNSGLNVPFLNPLMVFITKYNAIVFLALFMLFFRREGRRAFIVLLIALASFGITDWTGSLLKDLFMRPRPCQSLNDIVLLVKCTGLSMPSNHAANSFAFAMPFIILSKWRLRWIFPVFAAIVAYSRIYVGVHYPCDVAAGAVMGTAIGLGASYIYHRFQRITPPEDTDTSGPGERAEAP